MHLLHQAIPCNMGACTRDIGLGSPVRWIGLLGGGLCRSVAIQFRIAPLTFVVGSTWRNCMLRCLAMTCGRQIRFRTWRISDPSAGAAPHTLRTCLVHARAEVYGNIRCFAPSSMLKIRRNQPSDEHLESNRPSVGAAQPLLGRSCGTHSLQRNGVGVTVAPCVGMWYSTQESGMGRLSQ